MHTASTEKERKAENNYSCIHLGPFIQSLTHSFIQQNFSHVLILCQMWVQHWDTKMDTTESLTLRPTKVVQARDDGELDKEDEEGWADWRNIEEGESVGLGDGLTGVQGRGRYLEWLLGFWLSGLKYLGEMCGPYWDRECPRSGGRSGGREPEGRGPWAEGISKADRAVLGKHEHRGVLGMMMEMQ